MSRLFEKALRNALREVLRPVDAGRRKRTTSRSKQRVHINDHADTILSVRAAYPDMTLHELRSEISRQGINVGISTIWRFLDERGLTRRSKRQTLADNVAIGSGGLQMPDDQTSPPEPLEPSAVTEPKEPPEWTAYLGGAIDYRCWMPEQGSAERAEAYAAAIRSGGQPPGSWDPLMHGF